MANEEKKLVEIQNLRKYFPPAEPLSDTAVKCN